MATRRTPSRAHTDLDAFLAARGHPLSAELTQLRKALLSLGPHLREELKWNSVSFRNAHDFFATVHLRSEDTLQLVLHTGVTKKATATRGIPVEDPAGLITRWMAKDRCLLSLGAGAAFSANRAPLLQLVKAWERHVGPS